MSTVAAPVAPETKPVVEQPPSPTPEQIERKRAFLDRITGKTAEEAQKLVAGVKEFENSHVERATRMPKTKAQIEEDAASATKKAEDDAKAAAEAKEPPKEKQEPEAKATEEKPVEAKPKRVRRTVQEEDDRIATVAAQAATKAVQAVLPKPEVKKDEPAPVKYEDTLPKSEKRKLETLQELERLYPEKKGVVQAFVEGTKAYDAYVKNWEKTNPGQKFDEADQEHSAFFEAQEAKLNYSDDEFEEAQEARIASKAREQFEREHSAKETERDRKIRMIEEKENVAAISDHAGAKVLELLEIPKLDEAPAVDREVYEKGVTIAKKFASEAYSVMNGMVQDESEIDAGGNPLVGQDGKHTGRAPKNPLHAEVAAISRLLMRDLGALPAEDTKNDQGQTYAQPWEYDKLPAAERAERWTIGPIDVIEYKVKHLSDQVKNHIAKENERFEARAKSRGVTLETPQKKQETKPANPAPTPAPAARKGGAPALGSDVISVAPSSGGSGAPKKGRDLLASLWAPK